MTYLLTPHLLEDRLPDLGCPHHHPSVHQTKPEGVADNRAHNLCKVVTEDWISHETFCLTAKLTFVSKSDSSSKVKYVSA